MCPSDFCSLWIPKISVLAEAPIWGGVYVGPASNVSLYSLSSYALADGQQNRPTRPTEKRKFFGRSRSQSQSDSAATNNAGRAKIASGVCLRETSWSVCVTVCRTVFGWPTDFWLAKLLFLFMLFNCMRISLTNCKSDRFEHAARLC